MKDRILIAISSAAFTFFLLSGDSPVWCRLLPLAWLAPFIWVNFGRYVVEDIRRAIRES